MHGAVATLPGWLVLGVLLGGVASVVIAGVFVVGLRLFPTAPAPSGTDGGSRRRREIRRYLRDVGEQFAEDHPVAGREVAFYLPERDVAITFDPRAYYRIAGSSTHPVLVEHEMPGVNLGYRLPFETPATAAGERGGPEPDPREAAFAVLGLPAGATVEEVKRAYRERIKEVHPDHGGDREQFRRVREAYTTAREHAT